MIDLFFKPISSTVNSKFLIYFERKKTLKADGIPSYFTRIELNTSLRVSDGSAWAQQPFPLCNLIKMDSDFKLGLTTAKKFSSLKGLLRVDVIK